MPAIDYAGNTVEINDEGFLVNSDQWTPEVADAIAGEVGLSLGDMHWNRHGHRAFADATAHLEPSVSRVPLGEALGRMMCEAEFRDRVLSKVRRDGSPDGFSHPDKSLLSAAYEMPLTKI